MDAEVKGLLVARDNDDEISLTPVGARVDIDLVDALAQLHLAARRLGLTILVRDPCPELRGLLDLAGLAHILVDSHPSPPSSTPSDRP